MRKPKKEIQLTSYDELLGINEAEQNTLNQIVEVPLNELHPFRNHPFHVNDDEKMAETVESIKNYGILNPALVRPRAEGGYELIAGHRRKRGCELAGKSKMPVLIRNYTDDEAVIVMVDSNIQRENLLPSEKAYRLGVEYGSARWGTEKDIRPYADPEFENNIILTETESLTMSSRPKNPKYARNKNILVIGGSGSGKTRFFVKPNIMQMHSSYVITDPKGTVLLEVGSMLAKGSPMTDENGKIVRDKEGKVIYEPYKIKVLNTINFKKSMHYNPFVYIRSEKDILKLVTTIIANTKGEGQQSGEDFWVSATRSQAVKSLRTVLVY